MAKKTPWSTTPWSIGDILWEVTPEDIVIGQRLQNIAKDEWNFSSYLSKRESFDREMHHVLRVFLSRFSGTRNRLQVRMELPHDIAAPRLIVYIAGERKQKLFPVPVREFIKRHIASVYPEADIIFQSLAKDKSSCYNHAVDVPLDVIICKMISKICRLYSDLEERKKTFGSTDGAIGLWVNDNKE